jgi:hypothetical protein
MQLENPKKLCDIFIYISAFSYFSSSLDSGGRWVVRRSFSRACALLIICGGIQFRQVGNFADSLGPYL